MPVDLYMWSNEKIKALIHHTLVFFVACTPSGNATVLVKVKHENNHSALFCSEVFMCLSDNRPRLGFYGILKAISACPGYMKNSYSKEFLLEGILCLD